MSGDDPRLTSGGGWFNSIRDHSVQQAAARTPRLSSSSVRPSPRPAPRICPLQSPRPGITNHSRFLHVRTAAMALLTRIYFNAVFGALGGLLGWMLFGVFGDTRSSPTTQAGLLAAAAPRRRPHRRRHRLLRRQRRGHPRPLPVRFVRLASYGVVLGAVGGAVGMVVGDWVNLLSRRRLGASRRRHRAGIPRHHVRPRPGLDVPRRGRRRQRRHRRPVAGQVQLRHARRRLGGFVGGVLFGLLLPGDADEPRRRRVAVGGASAWSSSGPASARCRPWCRASSSRPRSR